MKKIIIKFPYKSVRRFLADLDIDQKLLIEGSRAFGFTIELEDGRAIVLAKETESEDVETSLEKNLVDEFAKTQNKKVCGNNKQKNCVKKFESDKIFVDYYLSYSDAVSPHTFPNTEETLIIKNGKCVRIAVTEQYVVLESIQDSPDLDFEITRKNDKNEDIEIGKITQNSQDKTQVIFEYSNQSSTTNV